jgi:hypothetical protein
MRIVECQQYDETWWKAHRGVAGSSCADRIITAVKGEPSKSMLDLACELLGQEYDSGYGIVEGYVNAAMKNGHIMEPESRRYYEWERGCDVQQVGFCLTDDGRFGDSPDSLCGEDGVLELKNPSPKTQIRYLNDGGLPNEYKPQCHWHLLVTQRKWCDFMSYSPGLPPLLLRVVPDEYTLKLAEAMETFWKLYTELRDKIRGAGDPVAATREPYVSPF